MCASAGGADESGDCGRNILNQPIFTDNEISVVMAVQGAGMFGIAVRTDLLLGNQGINGGFKKRKIGKMNTV